MDILPNLVSALNKEEIKNLKLYLNRTRADEDKKNELLFDLIKKESNETYNEAGLFKKIYPNTESKLSFNRLKSRLIVDISKSLATFRFNASDEHFILNNYLLFKTFLLKNEFELAKYYIKRAEKKAEEIQYLELLDLIYNETIKLSQEITGIDPEHYIKKKKLNRIKLNDLTEMDDILATIINQVRLRGSILDKNTKVYKQLENVVDKFNANKLFKNDLNFRIRIYQAITRILLGKKDYVALEDYLIKTHADFTTLKAFDKNTHNTKIQILIYISNTLFINEKYEKSLEYAEKLKIALQEYDGLLYDRNVIYYYNVVNNNYSEINPTKAIEILNEAKNNKLIQKHPYYMCFVYYNLTGCYYDLKEFKQALKTIVKIYTLDSYNNIDDLMKMKIIITEIILRVQTNDFDYAETKITKLKKEFKALLKNNYFDNELILFITEFIKNGSYIVNINLKTRIENFIKEYNDKDTTEVISYSLWLKSNVVFKTKAGILHN